MEWNIYRHQYNEGWYTPVFKTNLPGDNRYQFHNYTKNSIVCFSPAIWDNHLASSWLCVWRAEIFLNLGPLRSHLLAFQVTYSKHWSGSHQVCRSPGLPDLFRCHVQALLSLNLEVLDVDLDQDDKNRYIHLSAGNLSGGDTSIGLLQDS